MRVPHKLSRRAGEVGRDSQQQHRRVTVLFLDILTHIHTVFVNVIKRGRLFTRHDKLRALVQMSCNLANVKSGFVSAKYSTNVSQQS